MLHLVESLSKGDPKTPDKYPRLLVTFHSLNSKVLFLKTQFTYVIKHGDIELMPNSKLHTYYLSFKCVISYFACCQRRRVMISITLKP